MSNTCFAGMRKVTSHPERNSIILASRLGRMFWAALKAGSRSGTCAAVGTPAVRLAYSSAKKSRHILETHWLGFSIDADGRDASGMPRFETARDLPLPGDAWSPEAMLTWMYERCMPRHEAATTDARRTLYAERLGVLRVVMRECRSHNEELRFAASQMTRTTSDISSDGESPNNGLSAVDMCAVLDDAQRGVNIGTKLVETLGAISSSTPAASSHVNAVADAMTNMLASTGEEAAE